ncbi:hypothetical protein [Herminiimonas sp. CN]|uniref:hypothetical protein n=1 Tax=Herminiimonas sp. CN TaxID=1349818 RepID=UPI000473AF18|nr:hypothetical protein [Herminiimonas sp. CN]
MSRVKKLRNKAYKPKCRSITGGLPIIANNRIKSIPLPEERRANVCIAYCQAIEAMTNGRATEYHLDTIIYALGIGVVLAENGIGGDHIELLRDATAGARRTKERYLRTGVIGLDGDALIAMRAVYDLHEAQLRLATHGELQAAIAEMHRRVA